MTTRKPITITTPLPKFDSDAELELWLAIHAEELPQPVTQYYFAKPRRFRADFAWVEPYRVLCEVEGGAWVNGRHNRPSQFQAQLERYNIAAIRGWLVVRVDVAMIRDGRAVETIKAALQARRRAVA